MSRAPGWWWRLPCLAAVLAGVGLALWVVGHPLAFACDLSDLVFGRAA